MIAIPGYQVTEEVYESVNTVIYRGYKTEDGTPVIVKTLRAEYPAIADIARIKHEYEIITDLDIPGIVKSYSLEKYNNRLALILEDFRGESLKKFSDSKSLETIEFLRIAIQVTAALSGLHKNRIIHKDIKPQNIIINPETGQLKLIDFSISSRLSRETQAIANPDRLEGTLAYMSPEQTGRMNRAIDYRTDFYSLGVTFYELLTHQLPFEAGDAMELVHCHIAKQPIPPCELNSKIPKVLSAVVLKLLAKTAEDRYQSAYGIKADLQECLTQLQVKGKIEDFKTNQHDVSEEFQIPQKLYGREREVETLLAAFERVAGGEKFFNPQFEIQSQKSKVEMLLVSGYSGIGKSALVNEVHKPITRQKGYFISGKFDQLQRNIPYASLIQAFSELIRQLLTESEVQIASWREKLLAAFGVNGQAIVDVIPEVELIVGKQPTVAEVAPAEAQNRFNLVFQNFINVFTKQEHPLVIFLDDLQWTDSASLKLLQLLLSDPDSKYLFLIGAYRDNEVDATHPLMLTLEEIKKTEAIINHIVLSPLNLNDVNQLIADTLKCEIERAQPLAELVIQKTNGNPFFINEFLKSLYLEKLLEFDFNRGSWQWNLEQIQQAQITDNVVELMSDKILKLREHTQQVLKLAACIGNQFDLKTLAVVNEKLQSETAAQLWEAVQLGLILPIGNDYKFLGTGEIQLPITNTQSPIYYKFLHDRVQQAAYFLIPEDRKQVVHLQVGQLLLKNTPPDKRDEKIFDIVNQLNFGTELVTEQQDKDELAELNLIAGKKAKASAGYEPALSYLKVGLGLLDPPQFPLIEGGSSWQKCYELTLALHVEAAEAAYLSGKFEEMEQLAEVVLQQARMLLDKVKVYEVKIAAFIAQNKLLEAVKTALQILNLLGVKLPEKPSKVDTLLGLAGTKLALAGRRIESLIDLPEMTDPYKLAAIRVLVNVNSSVYLAIPELFPLFVFKEVDLSIKYGNAAVSASGYACYGLILCAVVGDIKDGYQFGQIALSLLDKLNAKELKAKTFVEVNLFVRHWQQHVRETLPPFLEAYPSGLESGNLEYAAWAAHFYCSYSYFTGRELSAVENDMAKYSNAISKIKQKIPLNYNLIFHQTVLNLLDKGTDKYCLVGEVYDEHTMLPLYIEANDKTSFYYLYFNKLILCYLFRKYQEALENAGIAEEYIDGVVSTLFVPLFYFYNSLAQLGVFPDAQKSEQKRILNRVATNQKKMKKWAHHAPMNHLHKFYLVEAERYRVVGEDIKAVECYDRAINLAKENEYINEEALAHELAARFYIEKGKVKIASAYLLDARYCYLRWGATAKVKHLDEIYPQLLVSINARIEDSATTTSKTNSSSSGEALDLATVMKASGAIASEIVLDKLLAKLMKLAIENAGAQKGFLLLSNNGELKIEAAGEVGREEVILQSIPVDTSQYLPIAIVNYVVRTQSDLVLNDATREGIFTTDTYITTNQPKSILCAPIINRGKLIGILYLENNLIRGAFTPARLEVLRILSSQAAISIENALLYQTLEQKVSERTAELAQANQEITLLNSRLKAENIRMSAELEVTRQLQQMILPKESELQSIEGLDIAGFMEPADEVGGDYYDVIEHDGRVKIGIGDVTGHGLESGVLMIMVQTAVRTLLTNNEADPVKFLSAINRTIYDNVQRMNSDKNLSLSLLDYEGGTLRLSGQHEEMIVVRGGKVERIDTLDLGFPIGLEADISDFVAQTQVKLDPGDVVVLYTDGITEAENMSGVQYGLERLCEVIEQNWRQSALQIKQSVIEDLRRHIGEQKVHDDITLLVLKQK